MIVENKLKDYRQNASMTQESLAESLDVSRQTIIAIEKGNYTPSLLLAMHIAKIFKCQVEDIFRLKK